MRIKNPKLIFLFVLLPFLASGASLVPCGTGSGAGFTQCTLCDIIVLINNIVRFLLFYLALPIGVIAMLASGFFFLTAGGSEQQIQRGKDAFKYAVFGLLIAFGAWLIIDTILRGLVSETFFRGFIWNEFPGC